jgi:hypothetical protein
MAVDAAGNIYLASVSSMTNAGGAKTAEFVTVKIAPSTSPINSPPQVAVSAAGPTIAGGPGQPVGQPTGPTIAGRTMMLNASASDRDGSVVRVDFYDGETLIGSDNAAPYSYQWDNASLGNHAIIAAATDDSGATRASQTMEVTVTDAPLTFSISGLIATSASGTPIPNVTVFLNDLQTHAVVTATSDANGHYTFDNLTKGSSYIVSPYGSYIYQPANATVNNLQAGQQFNFSGTPVDPPNCVFSLSLTTRNFSASGGNSAFNINAEKGCSWKARSNNAWIILTGQTDGSGQTPISYRLLENSSTTARTGTISVADQTFTVTQDAASATCTITLSQSSESFGAEGGIASLSVKTGGGCSWSAVSNDGWITIDAGGTGLGTGSLTYSLSANHGAFRTGTINIGGQLFTVEQKSGQ